MAPLTTPVMIERRLSSTFFIALPSGRAAVPSPSTNASTRAELTLISGGMPTVNSGAGRSAPDRSALELTGEIIEGKSQSLMAKLPKPASSVAA